MRMGTGTGTAATVPREPTGANSSAGDRDAAITSTSQPPSPPARGARHSRAKLLPLVLGTAGVVVFVGAIQLLSAAGVIPREDVPPPSQIFSTLLDQVTVSGFWRSIADTMQAWLIGLGLALVIAIPLGVLMGRVDTLYRALRPTVEFLRPIPTVALIPVVILMYGTDVQGNILLTAFATLWPLLIQSIDGARDVDPVAMETLRSFRVKAWRRVLFAFIPNALPHLATGFRIATSVALIVTITSELVIGTPGLGYSIVLAQNAGNLPLVYALIVASGLLGVLIHVLTTACERRALHWHPSTRNDQHGAAA